jgi:hypothetical protein
MVPKDKPSTERLDFHESRAQKLLSLGTSADMIPNLKAVDL